MDLMRFIKGAGPGLGITFVIAAIAYLVSSLHPSFDVLVISIILGMLVANMFDDREFLKSGLDTAVKIFLPAGIALYGLELNLSGVELTLMPSVWLVLALMFGLSYFICRGFGLKRELAMLLSTGLSVCGASAIVIIAPLIGARREDTSISILSVVTVGLTGMLLYMFMPGMLGLTAEKFAFLTGTTLPMLGQVKVAALAMGPESLSLATGFKLLRISALFVVALLAVAKFRDRRERVRLPWFMVVFLLLALLVNLSPAAAAMGSFISPFSKIFLTVALSAVGLSIEFDSVTQEGTAPLVAIFLAWGIMVMFLFLVLSVVI